MNRVVDRFNGQSWGVSELSLVDTTGPVEGNSKVNFKIFCEEHGRVSSKVDKSSLGILS